LEFGVLRRNDCFEHEHDDEDEYDLRKPNRDRSNLEVYGDLYVLLRKERTSRSNLKIQFFSDIWDRNCDR